VGRDGCVIDLYLPTGRDGGTEAGAWENWAVRF
jgi:hypothetical protein